MKRNWRGAEYARAKHAALVAHAPKPPLPMRFRPCDQPYHDQRGQPHGCGRCDPCQARKRSDAIGRCLMECFGHDVGFTLTLTIGGDTHYGGAARNPMVLEGLRKQYLVEFVKRLRTAVHERAWLDYDRRLHARNSLVGGAFQAPDVRVFATGEYGTLLDRPHYHLVLWLDRVADLLGIEPALYEQRLFLGRPASEVETFGMPVIFPDRRFWEHGMVHLKPLTAEGASYAAKYVAKSVAEQADGGNGGPRRYMEPWYPHQPFMGQAWMVDYALRHVEAQLPLKDGGYRLVDLDGDGFNHGLFHFRGRHKDFVVGEYLGAWRLAVEAEPGRRPESPPASEMVENYLARRGARLKAALFECAELLRHRLPQLMAVKRIRRANRLYPDGMPAYGDVRSGAVAWDGDALAALIGAKPAGHRGHES